MYSIVFAFAVSGNTQPIVLLSWKKLCFFFPALHSLHLAIIKLFKPWIFMLEREDGR